MGYGCSFCRGRVSRPIPPAGYCTCKRGGKPAPYDGNGGCRGREDPLGNVEACTAPRPPLTRGLDFAKQKTGGENNLFLLSLRLPFGQPPPSSEGGFGWVRTRRRVWAAEETVRFRAATGRPYRPCPPFPVGAASGRPPGNDNHRRRIKRTAPRFPCRDRRPRRSFYAATPRSPVTRWLAT